MTNQTSTQLAKIMSKQSCNCTDTRPWWQRGAATAAMFAFVNALLMLWTQPRNLTAGQCTVALVVFLFAAGLLGCIDFAKK